MNIRKLKLFPIDKHKQEILLKSGLSRYEFDIFVSLISSEIEFVQYPEIKKFIPEAKEITPDINDAEYFALALKLNCSIWSNDKRLKQQNKVKVYSTSELMNVLI